MSDKTEFTADEVAAIQTRAYTSVGRCGHQAPTLVNGAIPAICSLPAGHQGWHRDDYTGTEWGRVDEGDDR